MIVDDIMGILNLPNSDLKVKLEIEVQFDQDGLGAVNSDYDFWQLILDMEPVKTKIISAELIKREAV